MSPEYEDPYEHTADRLGDDDLGLVPTVTPYDKIKRDRVRWIWPNRLPKGKLVIFDGDPDVGKSTVSVDLCARLTVGSPLPDGYLPPHPINVLFLRAEDGAADTVLPRLLAAGGDPSRFMELTGMPELDDLGRLLTRPPEVPTDVLDLATVITRYEIGLVLIDPLVAFLADWVNSHRDQSIRRALTPLAALAERTGASILGIRHLNKASELAALYRGGGSIGILAAARLVLVAGHDPDNKGRRLLGVLKSNLAPKPSTLAYQIIGNELYDCGQIQWLGVSDRSAADILALQHVDDDERSAIDEAVHFLFTVLGDGPVAATAVLKEAAQVGISERTLNRAKRLVGVVSEKAKGTKVGGWTWSLPNPDELLGENNANP